MVKIKTCIEYYNFIDDISLYTVESLKKTLKKHTGKIGIGNKSVLFNKVKKCMTEQNNDKYTHIYSIIKIQSLFRMAITNNQLKLCGPGFFNRKNMTNDTDFLTCESYNTIPYYYFFSYKDNDDFIYYFDIRSLKTLIRKSIPRNPYNRNLIPYNIISNMNKRINYLKSKKISLSIDDDPLPDNNSPEGIKRLTNDIFIELSSHGYIVQQEWLTTLSLHKHILLYRHLEDIWNFRSELTHNARKRIVPPNGMIFTVKPQSIINVNLFTVKKLIINETYKLIMSGENIEDRKTGMMYFIIALSEVNNECLIANPWVSFLNTP